MENIIHQHSDVQNQKIEYRSQTFANVTENIVLLLWEAHLKTNLVICLQRQCCPILHFLKT